MPHQVPVTTAIIVRNIDPESTRDDFWFYFENPRKGFGGEVQDVILKTTEGCCIVFFKDPKGQFFNHFLYIADFRLP